MSGDKEEIRLLREQINILKQQMDLLMKSKSNQSTPSKAGIASPSVVGTPQGQQFDSVLSLPEAGSTPFKVPFAAAANEDEPLSPPSKQPMKSPHGQELPTWRSNGVKQSSDSSMKSPHGQELPMWQSNGAKEQSNGVKESPDSSVSLGNDVVEYNKSRTKSADDDAVDSTKPNGTTSDESDQQKEKFTESTDVVVTSDFGSCTAVADEGNEVDSVVYHNPLTELGGVARSVQALTKIESAVDVVAVVMKAMASGYVSEVLRMQDSLIGLRPPPRPPDRVMVV